MRKKNARDDQNLLTRFHKEISSLKRLQHQHLVSVIGSYTDMKSVAYLMEPIGQCNLMEFLCQPRSFIDNHLPSLRTYFGCLANAVAYLHRQRVRHRDLKPQNILVKNFEVYITDFGNALDWSRRGRDTTNDSSLIFTEYYVAPEIAKRSLHPRNSAADTWSLGVVFLDILTVLRGSTIRALRTFLEYHGTRNPYVWGNAQATSEWSEKIRQLTGSPDFDNEPLMWIKDMTQSNPGNRPSAGALTKQIRGTAARGAFIGHCCVADDDSEDYPSPSSSRHSEEDSELHADDVPIELIAEADASKRPLGSLVGPARQNTIERWMDVVPGEDKMIGLDATELPDYIDDVMAEAPYDIVVDDSVMAIAVPSTESVAVLPHTSVNHSILDHCEGYDIIQDDSDDEEQITQGGFGYEVMEDTSESDASTIRQAHLDRERSGIGFVLGAANGSRPDGNFSDDAIQALEAQLDAIPEDVAAAAVKDHQMSGAFLPVTTGLEPQMDAKGTNHRDRKAFPQGDSVPGIKRPGPSDTPASVEPSIRKATESKESFGFDDSRTAAGKAITPPPNGNEAGSSFSQRRNEQGPDDRKAFTREYSVPGFERSGSPDTPAPTEPKIGKPSESKVRFEFDDNENTPDTATTPPPNRKQASSNFSKRPNERKLGFRNADQDSKSTASSLNAENLARLAEATSRAAKSHDDNSKSKTTTLILDEARISPSVYMQEVWEAASSIGTSMMSERTRKAFGGFGSGLAWQDRTANFLEKYAKAGKAAAVRACLDAGCNPGTRENPRIRPLMAAVKGGSQRHNKCVVALLAAGADVNARERSGKTALHYAIEHQDFHGYTNLIRDLLEAGADPNNRDKSGDFPLLQILYGGYDPLEKHKRDALACLLRSEFATDVNVMPPGTLNMPLHLAIRRKDPWAVSLLVYRGAKVNEPNGSGMTPLMLAADGWKSKMTAGQKQILTTLLDNGVNVDGVNTLGKTALHIAAESLCAPAVRLLLDGGADPQVLDNLEEPHRPYHYAKCSPTLIKKFPEAHADIMQVMLKAMGFDYQNPVDYECAIVTAVKESRLAELKQLAKRRPNFNHIYESMQGISLLQLASSIGNDEIYRFLVDHGATVSY